MSLSRRSFLVMVGVGMVGGVLGSKIPKLQVFNKPNQQVLTASRSSVAQGTQDFLGGEEYMGWRGEEIVRLGEVGAYTRDHRGLEYYVDGNIPMIPARDFQLSPGLHFVAWVVKNERDQNYPILSFPVKIL